MNKKPSICFLAPAAWSVISRDRSIKAVGGAEVQISFLARAFAGVGHRVTMICMDYGQEDGVEIDGVRILKMHEPQGGVPIVRFVHPRFTSVWWAMRRADADVYYQRAAGVHTGYVAAFCRLYGRKFVFAAAHDADFDPAHPLIRYSRDKAIFKWGLRRADAVIVQNPVQKKLCKLELGREAQLIRSCYEPPAGATCDKSGYVLWVSTMRRWKRPELFIELARQLPQYRFRMVGGGDGDAYYPTLQSQAATVPNLEFVGFVPHADVEREFSGARIFVNTSEHEGFPNTFLQAWARGIPCVSFVDTGSAVDNQPVLRRVQDLNELTTAVDKLMSDDCAWREAGLRSSTCYSEQHSLEVAQTAYTKVFDDLLRRANR